MITEKFGDRPFGPAPRPNSKSRNGVDLRVAIPVKVEQKSVKVEQKSVSPPTHKQQEYYEIEICEEVDVTEHITITKYTK